ncbi:MAG: zf-HC2 domain-containing protein [Phycisphaerales bacterium]|nr:MAG: zf-HC2 domain-containing protein [Phycisphaerales bacterium]
MMDCEEFCTYVGAFVDGELETERNFEALQHVNSCPGCAARAAEIPALKGAVARAFSEACAPQYLQDRLTSSLETCVVTPRLAEPPSSDVRAARPRLRFLAPLGMAAAIGSALLLWQYWPGSGSQAAKITVATGKLITDVREQHRLCVEHRGLGHHDASLPRDLPGMARSLSNELQLAVIAPDLSTKGFDLVGADRCGIMGQRGAHVLYQYASTGAPLSVFTVGRVTELGSGADGSTAQREYFVSSSEPLCVVAWHGGPQTYAICGEFSEPMLLDLAGAPRTAGIGDPGHRQPEGSMVAMAR